MKKKPYFKQFYQIYSPVSPKQMISISVFYKLPIKIKSKKYMFIITEISD